MSPVVGQDIGAKLIKALGLPPLTATIDLHIAVDEPVTVTCESYPDKDGVAELVPVLKRYELHDRSTWQLPGDTSEDITISREMLFSIVRALRHTTHLEQIREEHLARGSYHDVGREMALPERAGRNHR